MITNIQISGFKSFHNFYMSFTPLTVVAGINASGKSNLFDALRLLSRLAETDLKSAFNEQRGNPTELFTQFDDGSYMNEMTFTVEMLLSRTIEDNWGAKAELNHTRMKYILTIGRVQNEFGFDDLIVKREVLEKIAAKDDAWAKKRLPKGVRNPLVKALRSGGTRKPFIQTIMQDDKPTIEIRQDGRQGGRATPANAISQTVLGGINSVEFPHAFAAKEEMRNWKFLQLNPEDLREPTQQDVGMKYYITPSGKNLASALYRIKQTDPYLLKEISRQLNRFLPHFTDVNVYDDQANRQFIIKLTSSGGRESSSRVLSEGTLRLLALCILEHDMAHTGLLCFEEPENGIHPLQIQSMAELLKELSINFNELADEQTNGDHRDVNAQLLRQVIVNTHSPVLLSHLRQWQEDEGISIWLARLDTLLTNWGNQRVRTSITKMTPVSLNREEQLRLLYVSDAEYELTLTEANKYLNTARTAEPLEKA